jgi:predicted nucleic-acid-binding Zn-ribbon protein
MAKQLIDEFEQEPPNNGNPLAKYFRVPGLHIRLPSGGAFMPPNMIKMTASGEIPVYPMTAADELLMKSPDALLSGFAIEKLIESCCPTVTNVNLLAASDVDAILLAIRVASFGADMELETKCPKCGAEHLFNADVTPILENVGMMEPEYSHRLSDDVVVYLRPFNLANGTRASLAAYQEAQKVRAFTETESNERRTQMNQSFERIARLNLELVADCILKVVVPGAEVSDRKEVKEFIDNVDRKWVNQIDTKLKDINDIGIDKSFPITCSGCAHEWTTNVEFDPASFFDFGS